MTVESVTYISDLNASNPAAGDPKSEGDDHIRNLKTGIKTTFPNVTGAVTPTHTELNYVDGVTSSIQTQLTAKATKNLAASSQTGGTLTNECVGKRVSLASAATIDTAFSEGDTFVLYNISGSSKAVNQGGSATMYFASTGGTGNRTLANGGRADVICVGTNTYIVSGDGLS